MAAFAVLLILILSFFLDESVDRWVAAHRFPAWETFAKLCSRYLAWPWLMGAAGMGLLLAWLCRRRDWMRMLCVMMIASSIAGLSADALRGLTGRTRPYVEAQGWHGIRSGSQWLITKHAYNSFPSGHVTAAVAFGLPLFLWRRWLAFLVFPFAGVVGGARIYAGAHHLSDAVAGAILGSLIAAWVWRRSFSRGQITQESAPAPE